MKGAIIHYLYHDGFIIETKSTILIFDYIKDVSQSGGKSLNDGVISEEVLKTNKKVFVFVTHSHSDHYNPLIFGWKKINPNIDYILSSDVRPKNLNFQCKVVSEGESIQLDTIVVNAYGSTDIGVSFLVKVDNINIFHAGDLNLWYWKDESEADNLEMDKAFKSKIHMMEHEKIDIAFFPVDPRLEEYYYLGGKYFIDRLSPNIFIPMHFGDNFKITEDFFNMINISGTKIVTINRRGQETLFQ